ncbi:hypothetical protein SAY87_030384 [Trapa incisa]|uniref:Formin-like protein n=1 Tax=Trapa incisa TaxID=236973 RepID=A0AAN7KVJ7_9MYRT|nr:hypothetical protein SAY87_030384 [Trapa incisa]
MEMRINGKDVVLMVVLLYALVAGWSEGRRVQVLRPIVLHLGLMMDQQTEPRDASQSALLSKTNPEEATEKMHPQVEQRPLQDCLRQAIPHEFVSPTEDVGSKEWFVECEALSHISRPNIIHARSLEGTLPNPSRDPTSPPPESHAPAPSPDRKSGTLPKAAPAPANLLAPSNSSKPSPDTPEMQEPLHAPPPKSNQRSAKHRHASPPPPDLITKEKKDDNDLMIIVVVVAATAATTFILVALIFLYCLHRQREKLREDHKDDSPLIKLRSNDDGGSSKESNNLGNLNANDFNHRRALNPPPAIHLSKVPEDHVLITPGTYSPETKASTAVPPLKLPPGKVDTASPGLPLQPPPGPPLQPPSGPPLPPSPGPPLPPPPKPRPPPLPMKARPPSVPPTGPSHSRGNSLLSDGDDSNGDPEAPKTKLKPFFWDKVMASPDHEMVWHEIKAGSFQFNEEMMESLFCYTADKKKGDRKKDSSTDNTVQYIQIIDPKKAQNLSILLRALNVTIKEVCGALEEGSKLPVELVQTLLKMAPTTQEELKLRLYSGDLSQLGPAERFLKVLVEVPFAFKRLEALQFMSLAEEEVSTVKESLETLEVACGKLKNSRLFLKLLEAVLKTGNRMNDGTYRGGAQAFKLDTLLKLSDVRGTDGKTTLLHFVVQEIIRSEGVRALRTERQSQRVSSLKSDDSSPNEDSSPESEHLRTLGLQVVSGLSSELEDVKKAAVTDADSLSVSVSKLETSLVKACEFLNKEMKSMEDSKFSKSLSGFVERMESEVTRIKEEEKRIAALVESTADYFHGNAGKSEGLRLFVIVKDFLMMLDKVCREVRDSGVLLTRTTKKETSTASTESPSRDNTRPSPIDMRQKLFPAIPNRQMYDSSSDEDAGD